MVYIMVVKFIIHTLYYGNKFHDTLYIMGTLNPLYYGNIKSTLYNDYRNLDFI
jgi:hypothetical protein